MKKNYRSNRKLFAVSLTFVIVAPSAGRRGVEIVGWIAVRAHLQTWTSPETEAETNTQGHTNILRYLLYIHYLSQYFDHFHTFTPPLCACTLPRNLRLSLCPSRPPPLPKVSSQNWRRSANCIDSHKRQDSEMTWHKFNRHSLTLYEMKKELPEILTIYPSRTCRTRKWALRRP